MSKITSVEDDLVFNNELIPKIQIEKDLSDINVQSRLSIRFEVLKKKRWKILSCCLGLHCVVFIVILCILATQYYDIKKKLRFASKRACRDICKSTMAIDHHHYLKFIFLCVYIANKIYTIYISYIKHLQESIVEAILPYLAIDVPMEDKVRDRPNIGAKENVHGILIVILSADV